VSQPGTARELRVWGVGGAAKYAPETMEVQAPFEVDSADVTRLRWQLEDFLEWPLDPRTELYRVGSSAARVRCAVVAKIEEDLPRARFEVVSDVTGPVACGDRAVAGVGGDLPVGRICGRAVPVGGCALVELARQNQNQALGACLMVCGAPRGAVCRMEVGDLHRFVVVAAG